MTPELQDFTLAVPANMRSWLSLLAHAVTGLCGDVACWWCAGPGEGSNILEDWTVSVSFRILKMDWAARPSQVCVCADRGGIRRRTVRANECVLTCKTVEVERASCYAAGRSVWAIGRVAGSVLFPHAAAPGGTAHALRGVTERISHREVGAVQLSTACGRRLCLWAGT